MVVVALGMYLLVLKPIMKSSLVNMILATVGLSLLIESLVLLKWGGYSKPTPPFTGDKLLRLGGVHVSRAEPLGHRADDRRSSSPCISLALAPAWASR